MSAQQPCAAFHMDDIARCVDNFFSTSKPLCQHTWHYFDACILHRRDWDDTVAEVEHVGSPDCCGGESCIVAYRCSSWIVQPPLPDCMPDIMVQTLASGLMSVDEVQQQAVQSNARSCMLRGC